MFTFANPLFLLLLPFVAILGLYLWKKNTLHQASLTLSNTRGIKNNNTFFLRFRSYWFLFKVIALGALCIAMARPQNQLQEQNINAEGIDIAIAIDVSGSMLAADFEPNRLEAAKSTAIEFIKNRSYDRIGLVVFSGESFTQCPLTTDQTVLKNLISEIKSGLLEDGTAIGMGLATAVSRLQESKAKSKVVILLTDGVNNAGFIDPLTAAETAKQYDVKVYTIGVGTQGQAPYPVRTIFGTQYQYMNVEIDEELLQKVAEQTGGKYFRATDNSTLQQIYSSIDKLEKTKIEVTTISRYQEKFKVYAIIAALCLALDFLFRYWLFKGIN